MHRSPGACTGRPNSTVRRFSKSPELLTPLAANHQRPPYGLRFGAP